MDWADDTRQNVVEKQNRQERPKIVEAARVLGWCAWAILLTIEQKQLEYE